MPRSAGRCCRWTPALGSFGFGVLTLIGLMGSAAARGDEAPSYNRDIRPILAENCFLCHGPDTSSRKADLRLDQRESALHIKAIVPGDVSASEMIARITATDPEEVMPPPDSHKQLTPAQKDTIRRWVAAGAEYQPHWAFLAPKRVEPPVITDPAWGRTPVDRFLRSKMAEQRLAPNGPADKRTLARRVSLDLTGLPPDAATVEAFVADEAPDAYEKLVDKLLASPAWGEHRGRYWLDAARYADTHGIHIDNYREIWSYRDWVINAFNANMPFDQFSIEQLAGDLLPKPTLDQQVATGFSRCNITTSEGGAINEEYLVLYARDRTETASQVFLGLTTGCAVCHDHKFDPFSQKEFYELSAFFNNTTQAAMDGNVKDTPPTVFVPPKADRDRWNALGDLVSQAKSKVAARREAAKPEFAAWLGGKEANPKMLASTLPRAGLQAQALLDDRDAPAGTPRATLEVAPVGDFERDQAFSFGMWVRPSDKELNGALMARMNEAEEHRGWDLWADGSRAGTHIIHRWPTDAVRVIAQTKLPANTWTHVLITYDGSSKGSGVAIYYNGKAQPTTITNNTLTGSIRTGVPLRVGQREQGGQTDPAARFHDLRIYNRLLPGPEIVALSDTARVVELLAKADRRTPDETEGVFTWFLAHRDEPAKALRAELAALEGEQAAIKTRGTLAHVMHERAEPPTAYVLFRGDYDKRRDQVGADTPDALPPLPSDYPKNRLGLAKWLFLPEHPLTARVTVNRFWQELFGVGLVRTTGDLGLSGELPSHPELLDWLAIEFREGGWDVKKFYKMLVMTTAYQQAATASPEAAERDPQNRYLARGPRFRMDAEMVRDSALAVGGLLSPAIGGPSVRPYQPDGVWEAVAMPNSDTHDYRRDSGEKLYRRSLYTMWKRSAPPASMDIMNAPSRETCVTRRERTNTPLQALVTLNDEQFVEAARHLAELTLTQAGADESSRFDFVARRLLGRPLRDAERAVVAGSLRGLLDHYGAHAAEAAEVIRIGESKPNEKLPTVEFAAWTMLCNELMNLDEVLNK